MTKNQNTTQKMHEAGTEIPASFVSTLVVPRKEPIMSKLGYFFAGIVAGAIALGAVAFLMDDADDTPLDFDLDEPSNLNDDAEPDSAPDFGAATE